MPSQDILRLHKIIKSSDRVREARDLFGLKKGEFILWFEPRKGTVTTRSGRKPRKVSSDVRDDMTVFRTDVTDYVKKDIIDYFGIKADYQTVERAIFFEKNFVPRSFLILPSVPRGTGRFKISIEFSEYPNAETRRAVIRGMDKELRLLKEMFRTKNTKGLTTTAAAYSQIKKISKFDAKFEVATRYKRIQKTMKKGEDKNEALTQLRADAAKLFKKSGITMDVIRREVFDFEKNFGIIEV